MGENAVAEETNSQILSEIIPLRFADSVNSLG